MKVRSEKLTTRLLSDKKIYPEKARQSAKSAKKEDAVNAKHCGGGLQAGKTIVQYQYEISVPIMVCLWSNFVNCKNVTDW
jgi:adenosine deaminase